MNLDNIISDFMNCISAPVIKLPNGLFVTCTAIVPHSDGQSRAVTLYYVNAKNDSTISIVGYPTKWEFDSTTGKWRQKPQLDPGIIDIDPGLK